jgi:hypothetical protein
MRQQAEAETYPLRRSFLEERLGHAVGVVQFDAQRLEETASATTLAGVLVTASNAPIGTLEFDTLTVLLQRYGNAACPDSKQIDFSLYELLRELGITPGTYQRRDLVQALVRLELLPYIQDAPNELEHHTLRLTDEVYEGLKLKARRRSDNRRTLQEAIANIRAVDPTYRTLEIHPCAHDKRMRELAIERWIGKQRQCRMRARSHTHEETGAMSEPP